MSRRVAPTLLVVAVLAALAACAPPNHPTTDDELRIVASTNVYGDLAATIAGPDAIVTAIIGDPSADPHGFQANPRVQLELAEADLVIANGGGYDDFVDEMLEASGNTSALVLHAVDFAGTDPTAAGFNEHVWYLYPAMADLVGAIGEALDGVTEDADRAARVTALQGDITDLAERVAAIGVDHGGEGFIVTEPVPQYMLDAAGLINLTPSEFTEAIEEDTDVAPALLQEVLNRIPEASVVVVNGQTGGPQTDAVIDVAGDSGVPWFAVTETLPDGLDYVAWQASLLDLLEDSLTT
ncbi:MAG TPA: zinc ABC transporter substrate-binding protein [Pseudolysinimonas sp.]|nr:zinc ABC transporter substrate-binding protein [Pseudolysinimonas sp.]